MSDNLLTIKEAAKILKVHFQTIRGYMRSGTLPYSKIGKNIRIRESDLENLINPSDKPRKFELEIRFATEKRKNVEEKLIRMDAKIIHHSRVIDHWFVPKSIKNIEEKNEWFDTGRGYGLRIREEDNGYTGKIATTIEIKRLATPFKHDTCIEEELDVKNYKEAYSLLSLMDMKEFSTLDKDRLVYKLGKFKIVIDDIKDFKTGIEIEVMSDKEDNDIVLEMKELARKLGLSKDELTDKSVTFLHMLQFAKF
jgi:predicted adenylyl cyclase CyaB